MTTEYMNFKVYGLDCIEEVTIIKKTLGKKISQDNLEFDLLNGKLLIKKNNESNEIASKEIINLIKKAGLNAVLWEDFINKNKNETFLKKNARLITTIISGIFILIAYLYHGAIDGFVHAFIAEDANTLTLVRVFYLLAIVFGSWFVVPKAYAAIKRFNADMNLLMLIAIVCAVTIGQLFEASIVSFLFSLSLLLEAWSVGNARSAITKLLSLTPETALVYCNHDKKFEEKLIAEVNISKTLLVKPGERVALDGEIIKGNSFLNQAPITGESIPVAKKTGDIVFAGSINGNSPLEIKTTKTSETSSIARIIKAVEQAQSKRSESEKWVDHFAKIYTPIMIILAIAVATIPPLIFDGNWGVWVYQAIVILVIACPCALVISTPISIVSSLASATRNGVLIKGGAYIEVPAKLKAIAFDKTGTLTTGSPILKRIIALDNISKQTIIQIAVSLEENIDHPIANTIKNYAINKQIRPLKTNDIQIIEGRGVWGKLQNENYWLGSHAYSHEKNMCNDKELHSKVLILEEQGYSLIFIGNDSKIIGAIGVQDALKVNITDALLDLKNVGVDETIMLTGDNYGTAKNIAKQSGVDNFYAELLPEDKVTKIQELVGKYKHVAMVGDGINDAPAFASSKLGIAMGAIGNDIAIETADVALMSDDISKLPWLINHSRNTLKIIKQNISFAVGLKVLFIGLAVMNLATLWMAIAADMGATFLVIMNALRLLKVK